MHWCFIALIYSFLPIKTFSWFSKVWSVIVPSSSCGSVLFQMLQVKHHMPCNQLFLPFLYLLFLFLSQLQRSQISVVVCLYSLRSLYVIQSEVCSVHPMTGLFILFASTLLEACMQHSLKCAQSTQWWVFSFYLPLLSEKPVCNTVWSVLSPPNDRSFHFICLYSLRSLHATQSEVCSVHPMMGLFILFASTLWEACMQHSLKCAQSTQWQVFSFYLPLLS